MTAVRKKKTVKKASDHRDANMFKPLCNWTKYSCFYSCPTFKSEEENLERFPCQRAHP